MRVGEIFLQTEQWTTRDGTTMALKEMAPGHRANLLRFLWRRVDRIREVVSWYWTIEVALHDGGDAAHDALEAELFFVEMSGREEFFDSLPLIKRLRELQVQGMEESKMESIKDAWEPSGTPTPDQIAAEVYGNGGSIPPTWSARIQALMADAIKADRAQRGAPAIERDRLPGYDLDKHSDLL